MDFCTGKSSLDIFGLPEDSLIKSYLKAYMALILKVDYSVPRQWLNKLHGAIVQSLLWMVSTNCPFSRRNLAVPSSHLRTGLKCTARPRYEILHRGWRREYIFYPAS